MHKSIAWEYHSEGVTRDIYSKQIELKKCILSTMPPKRHDNMQLRSAKSSIKLASFLWREWWLSGSLGLTTGFTTWEGKKIL